MQGGDLSKKYKNIKMRHNPKYKDIVLGKQDILPQLYNINKCETNNPTTPPFLNALEPKNEDKMYAGKAIVALTEAPTYNLFTWASRTYKINGNV